jgi:hypothetical protein
MPKNNVGFEFPIDNSGQWDGFNEAGMEHFSGNPFEHLGREVVQNSMDARLDRSQPVRIEIKLLSVNTSEIPGITELKAVIKRCAAGAEKESPKAKRFFEKAGELLSKNKINVLKISDYNTKGIAGPCENGKPYFAFMKATGQSKKESGSATGSFGIGKFAPYTVSGLRTVFTTTVWRDQNNSLHHYMQGKSILMSHASGKAIRRATGFYGVSDNCMPLDKIKLVPEWLQRTENGSYEKMTGTTLCILAFDARKDWQNLLIANIAENFFGAIYKGDLVVQVDDREISKDKLISILKDKSILDAIKDQKNEPEKFHNVQKYVEVLAGNSETVLEISEQRILGSCELRLLVKEDLPSRVAVLRNGMLITDELGRLKRFGEFKPFAAVLECTSTKGNELLREMEPPRHDDFEPDRLGEDSKKGKLALNDLAKWVREMLKRHAQEDSSGATDIDELADFFADTSEEGSSKPQEENPEGSIKIRARRVEIRKPIAAFETTESEEDSADGDEGTFGQDTLQREKDGSRKGKKSDNSSIGERGSKNSSNVISLQNVRAVPINASKRRITFTAGQSGTFRLQVQDSGADTNRKLSIISSSSGVVKNGEIADIKVSAGARNVIDIELDSPFEGTLRVVADAI